MDGAAKSGKQGQRNDLEAETRCVFAVLMMFSTVISAQVELRSRIGCAGVVAAMDLGMAIQATARLRVVDAGLAAGGGGRLERQLAAQLGKLATVRGMALVAWKADAPSACSRRRCRGGCGRVCNFDSNRGLAIKSDIGVGGIVKGSNFGNLFLQILANICIPLVNDVTS